MNKSINPVRVTFQQLKDFYMAVVSLTLNHAVENDAAVVYANSLGRELEKVNPNWHYLNATLASTETKFACLKCDGYIGTNDRFCRTCGCELNS